MKANRPVSSRARGRILMAALVALGLFQLLTAEGSEADARAGRALVTRYFAEWANRGDTNAAGRMIATNVVLRHPHVTVDGLETYKRSMAAYRAAFPDLRFTVEDMFAENDRVLARWTMTGTQRGEFQGHAAAGGTMRVSGMSLFRIERGRIQEIWVIMDRLGMQEQLGWLPGPARTNAPPRR